MSRLDIMFAALHSPVEFARHESTVHGGFQRTRHTLFSSRQCNNSPSQSTNTKTQVRLLYTSQASPLSQGSDQTWMAHSSVRRHFGKVVLDTFSPDVARVYFRVLEDSTLNGSTNMNPQLISCGFYNASYIVYIHQPSSGPSIDWTC